MNALRDIKPRLEMTKMTNDKVVLATGAGGVIGNAVTQELRVRLDDCHGDSS
jgi:FlaA1/EpsC-like NDP-sugar epimerase